MNKDKRIEDYVNSQVSCINELKQYSDDIEKILQELISARDNSHDIYIVGNGGSASTATHFCSDLLKTSIIENKKRFKAHSLSDNIPVVLAWSNDTDYKNIFVEQLENFLKNDDGSVYDLIDGPKYYKLVFDEYGVEIVCNGMINGFHMRMSLVDWIKEGSDKLKAQKKVA